MPIKHLHKFKILKLIIMVVMLIIMVTENCRNQMKD